MTNGEKYKTAQERYDVFLAWCDQHGANCHKDKDFGALKCAKCQFAWLDLEAEEEKPLPCPFCGEESVKVLKYDDCNEWRVYCECGYSSKDYKNDHDAIAAHNRVSKKCMEGNK